MAKITADRGVSLRKAPWSPYDCYSSIFLKNGTEVTVLPETTYDILGEKDYVKIRLNNGQEGWVIAEGVEE